MLVTKSLARPAEVLMFRKI